MQWRFLNRAALLMCNVWQSEKPLRAESPFIFQFQNVIRLLRPFQFFPRVPVNMRTPVWGSGGRRVFSSSGDSHLHICSSHLPSIRCLPLSSASHIMGGDTQRSNKDLELLFHDVCERSWRWGGGTGVVTLTRLTAAKRMWEGEHVQI